LRAAATAQPIRSRVHQAIAKSAICVFAVTPLTLHTPMPPSSPRPQSTGGMARYAHAAPYSPTLAATPFKCLLSPFVRRRPPYHFYPATPISRHISKHRASVHDTARNVAAASASIVAGRRADADKRHSAMRLLSPDVTSYTDMSRRKNERER